MLVSAQAHPRVCAHTLKHTDGCHCHPAPSHFHLVVPHFLLLDVEGYTTFMLLSGSVPPSDKMSLLSIS